jgi:uncharacterized protein YbjQ (UPF0145 family)
MRVEPKLTGLSGNEIYCMRLKGLTPSGVVIGNGIQSMGFLGGVRSVCRGIVGGEIPDVTRMIHEGREAAFLRMRAEADREGVHGVVSVTSELRALGAEEVVGIKTYIIELGSSLVEIFAVDTAVRKMAGVTVQTANLPAQAIIRAKDTWLSGSGGFDLQSTRAGG